MKDHVYSKEFIALNDSIISKGLNDNKEIITKLPVKLKKFITKLENLGLHIYFKKYSDMLMFSDDVGIDAESGTTWLYESGKDFVLHVPHEYFNEESLAHKLVYLWFKQTMPIKHNNKAFNPDDMGSLLMYFQVFLENKLLTTMTERELQENLGYWVLPKIYKDYDKVFAALTKGKEHVENMPLIIYLPSCMMELFVLDPGYAKKQLKKIRKVNPLMGIFCDNIIAVLEKNNYCKTKKDFTACLEEFQKIYETDFAAEGVY